MWIAIRREINFINCTIKTAMMPASKGHKIQVLRIFNRIVVSVGLLEKKFQPIIAPTIA